jgi:hypothetical protein
MASSEGITGPWKGKKIMQAFKVFENGKHIDTVFYVESMTAEEVKRSLINHDGYSESIKVVKERVRRGH